MLVIGVCFSLHGALVTKICHSSLFPVSMSSMKTRTKVSKCEKEALAFRTKIAKMQTKMGIPNVEKHYNFILFPNTILYVIEMNLLAS